MLGAIWDRWLNPQPRKPGRSGSNSQRRRARPTFRANLESLEDRLNLSSVFQVTNASDQMTPGSLRYEIAQANLPDHQGSTVLITSKVSGPIDLVNGELDIRASMKIVNKSGAPVEIHQETSAARVFHVTGLKSFQVNITGAAGEEITIDGGSVQGANGGGILVDAAISQLTLSHVDVLRNRAADRQGTGGNGGGIYSAGFVTLDHSVIGTMQAPNTATQLGGGLWTAKGATLTASTVEGNEAAAGGGGVAVNDGILTVSAGSSVNNNAASLGTGGGISVTTGSVYVSGHSHVDGNSAKDVGGILVGNVINNSIPRLAMAASVTGGSTVNGNSSTAGQQQNPNNLGGGGIAVVSFGNILVDASQVSNNATVGMYSGGILVGIGNVTVTNGSQVNGNSNNGPGGGIAANFGGNVTVTNRSQVNGNTGSALGGGIVNFSGPLKGAVNISNGSQVNGNTLTNGETIGRVVAVFASVALSSSCFEDFAVTAGGAGGAAMIAALKQVDAARQQTAGLLQSATRTLSHPLGELVAGGGISTLLAPTSITGGSQVSANFCGKNILGDNHQVIGLAGGIFNILGRVTVDQSGVNDNQAPNGDGGGIWLGSGALSVSGRSSISGNAAGDDGGGIWNAGRLELHDSTVSSNTAGGLGGGLFNASSGVAAVWTQMVVFLASSQPQRSTFQNNQAQSGGGMANAGTLTIAHSSLLNNVAASQGGGIYNTGTLHQDHVIFVGNTPDNVANA